MQRSAAAPGARPAGLSRAGQRWVAPPVRGTHCLHGGLGIVDHVQLGQVERVDQVAVDELLGHPVEQARPVGSLHEHHRELGDLAGLDERERLEQLIQRAEAAGVHDERRRIAHEHQTSCEEVVELQGAVEVIVGDLLLRELDVEPDGGHPGVASAPVGCFHDARAAAGDDRVPGLAQPPGGRPGELVGRRPDRYASGAEHRHRRTQVPHRVEPHGHLRVDAPESCDLARMRHRHRRDRQELRVRCARWWDVSITHGVTDRRAPRCGGGSAPEQASECREVPLGGMIRGGHRDDHGQRDRGDDQVHLDQSANAVGATPVVGGSGSGRVHRRGHGGPFGRR